MASVYKGRTRFKRSKVNLVVSLTACCVFTVVTAVLFVFEGWTVWSIGGLLLSLFAMAGIVDALTSYLEIKGDLIEFRRNFRKRTVRKEAIETASWAKGCPAVLVLKDGTRFELPELQGNGITNSINAWLRSSAK